MRLVHIADTHLGYRAYNKVNQYGLNAREVDVLDAFKQALAKVVQIKPSLILIAGDLFHAVRPSNVAIQYAFRELLRLRPATKAPIVIIGGNHDSPRSTDTGCILDLLANIDLVHVIHAEPKCLRFPELETAVFCLPHAALPFKSDIRIAPDPESRYNILLAHARPEGAEKGYDQYEITRDDVRHEDWDYVAYGHLHTFQELAPNAFHPGSLEYAGGLTVWEQFREGADKGFIEYDLSEHRLVKFHTVGTRAVEDLRPIDATGLSAEDVNAVIQHRMNGVAGGLANKIVRLVVENVAPTLRSQIDYSALRQVRADALHFELELRRAPPSSRTPIDGDRAGARTLEQEWDAAATQYQLPPGLDRGNFAELGRTYLAAVVTSETI